MLMFVFGCDKYPEAAFSNVGNVDEVIAKAKKMGAV